MLSSLPTLARHLLFCHLGQWVWLGWLPTFPPPRASLSAVGHHHPGHRALLPRVPEEGLPLRGDGDRGQELRRHSGPQVVLQVRRRGRESPAVPGGRGSARASVH